MTRPLVGFEKKVTRGGVSIVAWIIDQRLAPAGFEGVDRAAGDGDAIFRITRVGPVKVPRGGAGHI